MGRVFVVRTGSANLASVLAGLRRCGVDAVVTEDAGDVERAERLVLPGVGSFGAVMETLARRGLVAALRERFEQGRPTLAICLGLQVMAEGSEETPGVAGLGVLPVAVTRFGTDVRVPQLGWNRVVPDVDATEPSCLDAGDAYFAHSYRITDVPAGWRPAFTEHGGRFIAAVARDGVLACQFHPELSGAWGQDVMTRWLRLASRRAASC